MPCLGADPFDEDCAPRAPSFQSPVEVWTLPRSVCMADALAASGLQETPKLDTISYYDDSEPNWNGVPSSSERWSNAEDAPAAMCGLQFQEPLWESDIRPEHLCFYTPASGINFSENADYVAHLRSGAYSSSIIRNRGRRSPRRRTHSYSRNWRIWLVGGRVRNFITRLTTLLQGVEPRATVSCICSATRFGCFFRPLFRATGSLCLRGFAASS